MSPTSDHILLGAFIHGDEMSGQKEHREKPRMKQGEKDIEQQSLNQDNYFGPTF